MKKEREILEENFNVILKQINEDKSWITETTIQLIKEGISEGSDLLCGRVPIQTLDLITIYHTIKTIYNISKIEKANPDMYFTEIEVKELERSKIKKDKKRYPLVFDNVIKINDEQYALFLDVKELVELYDSGLIKYNFETQRNKKVSKSNNQVIESINVNTNSVNEMAELMAKDKFYTNFITINIINDGNDEMIFDSSENMLTIKLGELNILDGFHRSMAMTKALKINPNLKYKTGVYITNFDIDNAKRYMIQEDKKNKINQKYMKSLDTDNLANQIVKRINESSQSDLMGKISTEYKNISTGNSLVMWDTLFEAIDKNFNVKTRKDVADISKYLIDGFNYIIGSYPDMFINNITINKVKYLYAYNNMFVVYTTILSKLYGNDNWEYELGNKLKSIDFSINNKILEELGIKYSTNKTTLKVIKNIIGYFKEV